MIADSVAAAQRRKTDVAPAARSGDAVTGALLDLFEHDLSAGRGRAPERQRRARRCVDLAAVVRLHDLDVPIGAETARGFFDDAEQHIDPEAHIRRPDDRDIARRLAHHIALLGREAGGADHHRLAEAGGERCMFGGGGGRGKFEHDIAVADQLVHRLADRDADSPDPGKLADVLVDIAAAGRLAAAGDGASLGGRDLDDQHSTHPAAASDDTHLGLRHAPSPCSAKRTVTDWPAKYKPERSTTKPRGLPEAVLLKSARLATAGGSGAGFYGGRSEPQARRECSSNSTRRITNTVSGTAPQHAAKLASDQSG